jgi:coenzyme PQQ synthesis protein D (PqqD)
MQSDLSTAGAPSRIMLAIVTDTIRLRQDIAWREIDGEIVLLDLTGAAYYTVSRSGVVLWPAVVEGATVATLTERLAQEYSLDRQAAERDVRVLIDALTGEGLLEEPRA